MQGSLPSHRLQWVVVDDGDDTYLFSIGGYPVTGIIEDMVVASIGPRPNVPWLVTYREAQDAYT